MIARLLAWWRQWRTRRRVEGILRRCGCVCYCPRCKEPLNDQAACTKVSYGIYSYVCQCGCWSKWDFVRFPFPHIVARDEGSAQS